MRNLLFCIAGILLIVVATQSCKKESSNKNGTMQAKVNGILVVCDSSVRLLKALDGVLWGIEGYTKGPKGFHLLFPIGRGTGTYNFMTFNPNFMNEAFFKNGFNSASKATSGSVTVTHASDDHYSGTFSFPAQGNAGTIEITDGIFDVSL